MKRIVGSISKKYLKVFCIVITSGYLLLFAIAFVMKDCAHNDWVKAICHEYVYGPKNMIALIVNKMLPGTMEINSIVGLPSASLTEIPPHEQAIKRVLDRYRKQKNIDEKLKAEYESGEYTFQNPFVIVNPYDISPLTALVMFDTDYDAQVTVTVLGHDEHTNVAMFLPETGKFSQKHILPIYGLYPGEENRVEIKILDVDGNVQKTCLKIKTEKLPDYFCAINLLTSISDVNKYSSGLNFSEASIDNQGIKFAFDMAGDIRWMFIDARLPLATNFSDGKLIYSSVGAEDLGEAIVVKESYLGRIEDIYYIPNGIHHDSYVTNHNSLVVTTNHKATGLDSLQEIDLENGTVLTNVDYRKILPHARFVGIVHGGVRDWAHINSVVEHEGAYISSSNFQSAIIKHTKNGKIKWLLSDPQDYPGFWQQYLLVPEGENFEYPYNQHAAEVLPDYDNDPDTVDILLFDNGTSRNAMNRDLQDNIKMGRATEPPLYSRLVHYRINEKNMTVRQIWQYGKERPELFAPTRGDANLLPNGNILGTFNQQRGAFDDKQRDYYYWNTVYVEVNRSGEVVWECYATADTEANKYLDYRLCRTNIYNSSVDYSHLLDESHNYVPDEIMKKYGY